MRNVLRPRAICRLPRLFLSLFLFLIPSLACIPSLSLSLDLFLHPLLRRCVRVYVRARGTRRFFSRSPWHVPTADERPKIARSRATRRSRLPPCPSVPSTIYRSIDDRSFLPSRQNEKRNATRLFCRGEKRIDYTRVHVITLTFSRQFNQLYRSLFLERNGMVFPFDENVSVFSRSTISLSLTPPFCPRDSPTSAFSRATRALFLYLLSRLTTRLPAPPHHASSPPLFQPPVSRLEDLE